MTIRYTTAAVLALYLLIGILTFGHSYNAHVPKPNLSTEINTQRRGAGAFLSMMFWPFYWSIELWEAA